MGRELEKSVKQWLGVFIAIVSYYIIHEGTHLLLALILGVFEKIRFVGIWGIQIVTTEGSLNGISEVLRPVIIPFKSPPPPINFDNIDIYKGSSNKKHKTI